MESISRCAPLSYGDEYYLGTSLGVRRMGEDCRVPPLSRRVPGAADGPSPPPRVVPPALPETLLQRMRAAVDAAHAQAAQLEQDEARQREQAASAGSSPTLPRRVPDAAEGPEPPGLVMLPALPAALLAQGSATDRALPPRLPSSAPVRSKIPSRAVNGVAAQPDQAAHVDQAAQPERGADAPAAHRPPARAQVPAQQRRGRPRLAGRRPRVAVLVIAALVVIAAGSLGIALSRHEQAATARGSAGGGALGSAATARSRAASWVAAQVSRSADVSCDPVMCLALEAHGIPAGDLDELRPGSADPLGSDVIVATSAVRGEFGARLSSVYAPAVIASFGSGNARIDIRAIAPGGARAYATALSADLADRRADGAQLLHNSRIAVSAAASAQLAAGVVDSRLLIIIATLSSLHPVSVVGFGDSGPGASAGMPARSADLAEANSAAAIGAASYVRSIVAFLRAQSPPYLAAQIEPLQLPGGQPVLRVEFAAPSPLGLLASRGNGGT